MSTEASTQPAAIEFPPFKLDLRAGLLRRAGEPLNLRPKTFAVLCHLAERPSELVTKKALLDALWPNLAVTEDVVRLSVGELRQALGDDRAAPRFIETVARRGYRFIAKLGADAATQEDSHAVAAVESPHADGGAIVGRVRERRLIAEWLRATSRGHRQVAFISGEAGIGKTTLVEKVLPELARTSGTACRLARGQCVEQYGGGEPYLPVLDAFSDLGRGADGPSLRPALAHIAPDWVLNALGPPTAGDEKSAPIAAGTYEHTLHKLAASLDALAAETPLVLVLEDVHWSDYATLDLLSVVARRREPARLLVLCTLRATDAIVRGHPVAELRRELVRKGLCHEILLDGLSSEEIESYLSARFSGAELPDGMLDLFVDRTEGNPFFLVTLFNHLLEQGLLVQRDGRWNLLGSVNDLRTAVPEGLRAVIEPRLERLEGDELRVLEWGSVIGPDFPAHAIAGIAPPKSELADVEYVEQICDALVRRQEILRAAGESTWPEGSTSARYSFGHALYRQVVYQRIPSSTARRLHQSVGEGLESAYGVRTAEVASELASHFERSRDVDRAVRYRAEAAAQARSRSAYRESRLHLETALEIIRSQPETAERLSQEIALLQDFGVTLFAINGYGDEDGARAFTRMRELAGRLDGGQSLFQAMQGQFVVHTMRDELVLARALGEELVVLAEQLADHSEAANTRVVLAAALYNLAENEAARRHVERAWELFDPALPPLPVDVGITGAIITASIHACAGRVGLARDFNRRALERGAQLETPFHRAWSTSHAAQVCMLLDDVPGTRQLATEALRLNSEYDLGALRITSEMLLGWCDVEDGLVTEGLAAFSHAFEEYRATGQRFGTTAFGMILARSHLLAGDLAGARKLAEDSLAFASETGERVYEPEFHRVLGECRLAGVPTRSDKAAAVKHFERALAIAEDRENLLYMLRAATSLHRVQRSARSRLADLIERFSAEDGWADLEKARALLASSH